LKVGMLNLFVQKKLTNYANMVYHTVKERNPWCGFSTGKYFEGKEKDES
jgi:hypothetical protein